MNKYSDLEDAMYAAKDLASMALAIETAIVQGANQATEYYGALSLFTSLLRDHSSKIEALLQQEKARMKMPPVAE